MSIRFMRVACACLAAVGGAGGALAQAAVSGAPARSAEVQAPSFRSAFEAYRTHADPPAIGWRQANDTVGRIGGWRAYAREAQGQPLEALAAPASASAPSPVAPPAHDHSMHGGHR